MLGLTWEEWLVGDAQAEEPVAVFQWVIPTNWSLSHPGSAYSHWITQKPHQTKQWKRARIVVLRKPVKFDYFAPGAFDLKGAFNGVNKGFRLQYQTERFLQYYRTGSAASWNGAAIITYYLDDFESTMSPVENRRITTLPHSLYLQLSS